MIKETGLPPGWQRVYSGDGDGSCVVRKCLDSFLYAEVHYEPDKRGDHDYVLYQINRDGPAQRERKGGYEDLSKAMSAGNQL